VEVVTLSRESLVELIRVMLYSPVDASLLAAVLERVAAGDLGPLVAQAFRSASWSADTMALGVTLTVLCSEDIPGLQDEDIEAQTKGTLAGRSHVDAWLGLSSEWPRGPAPDATEAALPGVPALVLSGNLDPATPPRWGQAMSELFEESLHVVVPGAAPQRFFQRVPSRAHHAIHRKRKRALARCRLCGVREPSLFRGEPRGDQAMMELSGLRKAYGRQLAVESVSFVARDGMVTGLLGPNGAGKTTSLRVLAGLVRPDAGRALVDGREVSDSPRATRSRMGLLPESFGLYDRLTVREHVRYSGALRGLGGDDLDRRVDRVIEQFDLVELAGLRARAARR
jgi:ABC-type multidrug transport system fused ATPase/permease subunit